MEKYQFVLSLMTIIMTGCTAIVTIACWFSYREKKLKVDARPVDLALQQRLERIEGAVDAIATEVERISENQRFTSKLLVDRHGAAAPLGPGESAKQWEEGHHAR